MEAEGWAGHGPRQVRSGDLASGSGLSLSSCKMGELNIFSKGLSSDIILGSSRG